MAVGSATSSNELTFHPPNLWGLNFHFNTFNKFYIGDILSMKPYPMFPGAFAYGNHPVYKVDVLGIIVRKDEKAKVFIYAVDDGTGVISCCCWKQPFSRYVTSASTTQLPAGLHGRLNALIAEEKRLEEGYELGDLVHIRGKLKVFRDMMEIVSSYHRRIDNPALQTARMMELPNLYRQCYDRPFVMPYKIARELQKTKQSEGDRTTESVVGELVKKIEEVLNRQRLREFSISMLLDIGEISDLAAQLGAECDRTDAVGRSLLRLETDKGTVVCRRHTSLQYENVSGDCPLDHVVISLLQKECAKPKYAEKGCHYLHILDELHRTVEYSKLQTVSLLYVLQRLETNSDIIRITDKCYFPM